MKRRENSQLINKRKWQWIIAGVVSVVLFTVTYLTIDVLFSTNDDIRIMYALAGYNTGEPYPYHPFINFFLGKMISLQYQAFPQVPWYAVFHVCSIFTGITVTGKCCLKIAARQKLPIFIPVVLQVFLFLTIYLFPTVSMQFSTTPAILGIAAAALVFSIEEEQDKKRYVCGDLILSVLFLCFCYMTRSFTWYCVMCFYGLAVFYQILYSFPCKTKRKKKWLCIVCTTLVFSGICALTLRQSSLFLKEKVEQNTEFSKYDKHRAEFQDYGMHPDYYENAAFYNKIGWTENTYRAALGLLFLDENMNADSMQKITQEYKEHTEGHQVRDAYYVAKSIFESYRVAKTGIAVIVLLFLAGMFFCFGKKELWREALVILCGFFGYLLMFLFLSYRGRLPIRTFMVITVSEAVTGVLCLLRVWTKDKWEKGKPILIIGAACLSLLAAYNIRAVYFTDDYTKTQTNTYATEEQVIEFETYATEHADDVFIYDFTVATRQRNPFVAFPEKKPTNCIVSGGSYTFSTIYYKQLEANGLDSLYWEDLLKDNIYYVSADSSFTELVEKNIEEKTGKETFCIEVERFAEKGVKIYKFFQ